MPTTHATLSKSLFIYVVKEYLLSFLISFLFFFGIFLVNQLVVIARDVLSKQVDVGKALLLLFYAMPSVIALAFPFGSLVGALMTVGRLSADNEYLAMQAVGYGIRQIFLPIVAVSAVLTLISFSINNILLPLGVIQYRNLAEKLLTSNTELVLEPFGVTKFSQTTIVTDAVASGNIGAILLFDSSEEGRDRVLTAQKGHLDKSGEDAGLLKLDLDHVIIVKQGTQPLNVDVSKADAMSYAIKIQDLSKDIKNVLPSEMSFVDIYKRIQVKERDLGVRQNDHDRRIAMERLLLTQDYSRPSPYEIIQSRFRNLGTLTHELIQDRDLQTHWVEYWKKLSIPSACTTLVILGIPLGLFARRSARVLGLGVGLVVASIFWTSLLVGQFLAVQDLSSSPFLLIWAPNILFGILGALAFIPLVRR